MDNAPNIIAMTHISHCSPTRFISGRFLCSTLSLAELRGSGFGMEVPSRLEWELKSEGALLLK